MSASLFRIEPYEATHRDAVARLVLAIQRDEFGLPVTFEQQPDLVDTAGFFRKGGGEFWIARAGGQPVGTIGLLDIGGGQGALRKMFVAPAWRGKDKGVAQSLLDVLLAHAQEQTIGDIFLGTTAKFLAAHRFYARNGFGEIAMADLPQAFPRAPVDTKFFRRRSAAAPAA
jgi:N-acetylglutamate synthase-like GNAT family acetyltransferase